MKTKIRSKIIQIRKNAKYWIDDYIENVELIGMSPVGITFIDLHEGYKKLSEVDEEGDFLLPKICDSLEQVLRESMTT
ncbi:hypothetical protein [uncultured Brevibacillus sp.]|uniref:hypothetical protein n=1 Tax=uncultured Brevibacillus sp. TaxID=169970 RepID=UPI002594A0D8|nr:hypothetical protein [uncultured Brevibacillus sp.]